jgi:hypothetical protein
MSLLPSFTNDPISGIYRLGMAPTAVKPILPFWSRKVLSMLGNFMSFPARTNYSGVWKVSIDVSPRADELSGR